MSRVLKMDILQMRDEINRSMKCNYSRLSENDVKKAKLHLFNLSEDFKLKLKETKEPDLLINIVEEDKKNYDMPIDLMFLVYQRLIELQPHKNILLDFASYLLDIGGPDWEEELEAIRKFTNDDKIHEAVEVALKVDYLKYPFREGVELYPRD
ncbi:predicted protein [Methanosarcina acetivorans C2A]|uniref:Uncharacterized protein n=2 Tax=Methanosarcina acetivorans TaxID=2214 RepID=Q8TP80_METAC|nr:predicted protein [Methanosarcina acetivorans C2A]